MKLLVPFPMASLMFAAVARAARSEPSGRRRLARQIEFANLRTAADKSWNRAQ